MENFDVFFPPNSPDLDIIPFISSGTQLTPDDSEGSTSKYFFSPSIVKQFIKAPTYHSFSSELLDSPFPSNLPDQSEYFHSLSCDEENGVLGIEGTIYDNVLSPIEVFSLDASDVRISTSCNSPLTTHGEFSKQTSQITALTHIADLQLDPCVSVRVKESSETLSGVSESSYFVDQHAESFTQENDDGLASNDGSLKDHIDEEMKSEEQSNKCVSNEDSLNKSASSEDGMHVSNSDKGILDRSTNVSLVHEPTSNKGTKKKRKYKPRRHIPKTLNQRGNNRDL